MSLVRKIVRNRTFALATFFLCSAIFSSAQRGAITAPRNLAQLTDSAATIFQGFVTSAKVEPHPQLTGIQTVVVTVHVLQTLKGAPQSTYTFRQFIWDIRDRYDAAGYRRGQPVLLFMNKPSQYGLSSPVGLEQGRFRIMHVNGKLMAANGVANAGLLNGAANRISAAQLSSATRTTLAQHRSGPIALDQLSEMIGQLQRSAK